MLPANPNRNLFPPIDPLPVRGFPAADIAPLSDCIRVPVAKRRVLPRHHVMFHLFVAWRHSGNKNCRLFRRDRHPLRAIFQRRNDSCPGIMAPISFSKPSISGSVPHERYLADTTFPSALSRKLMTGCPLILPKLIFMTTATALRPSSSAALIAFYR